MSDQRRVSEARDLGFERIGKPERGAYSIQEAARKWGYDPVEIHNWVRAGNVPGVVEHEGRKLIAGRVVEAGRPHPSGHFGEKFRTAAEEADVYAGAGWPDHEAWRD